MANSDYVQKADLFGFCPVASLVADIDELDGVAGMVGYTSPLKTGIRIGMAAMIDEEIVKIVSATGEDLELARGCCDTVPAPHLAGAKIWFFDDSIAFNRVAYDGTGEVAVKILPKTASGGYVPIEMVQPEDLQMNLRFLRVYPPGLVEVGGDAWYTVKTLHNQNTLALTWAHRNRITQQDALIDHMQPGITPEVGTTYTLRFYNTLNTLVQTVAGVTDDFYSYEWDDAMTAYGFSTGIHLCRATLHATRAGFDSIQGYTIFFYLNADPFGLGYRLGESLGGVAP